MNVILCRICGGTEDLKHIDQGGDDLLHKLQTCANVSIQNDDELPKYICYCCEQGLEFSYNLRKRSEETEKKLRQRLAASTQDFSDDVLSAAESEAFVEQAETKAFINTEAVLQEGDGVYSNHLGNLRLKHRDRRKNSSDTESEVETLTMAERSAKQQQHLSTLDLYIGGMGGATVNGHGCTVNGQSCIENGADAEIKMEQPVVNRKRRRHIDKEDTTVYNVLAEVVVSDDDDDEDQVESKAALLMLAANAKPEADAEEYKSKQEALQSQHDDNFMPFCDEDSVDYFFLDDSDCAEDVVEISEDSDFNAEQQADDSQYAPSEPGEYANEGDDLTDSQDQQTDDYSLDRLIEPSVNIIELDGEDSGQNERSLNRYKCISCGKGFATQTEYHEHIKMHAGERFQCKQCSRWFPTRFRLESHERCHSENVRMVNCPECDRSFCSPSNLRRHLRTVHKPDELHTCELCGWIFKRADLLKLHMLKHEENCDYKCKVCSTNFRCKRYLTRHMKKHHRDSTSDQSTSVSSATAQPPQPTPPPPSTANITDVRAIERTYCCIHCGKISTRLHLHKNHLRTHTKDLPFACETCKKRFRTMAAVIIHERMHQENRPYQCEQCLMSFRQASHLKEHKLTHTGEQPHICEHCGAAFRKKGNLVQHRRIHTREAPYKCTLCDAKFPRLQLLKRHTDYVHDGAMDEISNEAHERDQYDHESAMTQQATSDAYKNELVPAISNSNNCKTEVENNDTNNMSSLLAHVKSEFLSGADHDDAVMVSVEGDQLDRYIKQDISY